jgi:hypothetical protein
MWMREWGNNSIGEAKLAHRFVYEIEEAQAESAKVVTVDVCAPVRLGVLLPFVLDDHGYFLKMRTVGSERQSAMRNGVPQVEKDVRQGLRRLRRIIERDCPARPPVCRHLGDGLGLGVIEEQLLLREDDQSKKRG